MVSKSSLHILVILKTKRKDFPASNVNSSFTCFLVVFKSCDVVFLKQVFHNFFIVGFASTKRESGREREGGREGERERKGGREGQRVRGREGEGGGGREGGRGKEGGREGEEGRKEKATSELLYL